MRSLHSQDVPPSRPPRPPPPPAPVPGGPGPPGPARPPPPARGFRPVSAGSPCLLLVAVAMASSFLFGSCSGNGESNTAAQSNEASQCEATTVHYYPYRGIQAGLAQIPWITASPSPDTLVGHLFYYDSRNAWNRERLPALHMYSGGESPDGRLSMKVLWELRSRSAPPLLDVLATRIDEPGSSFQRLPSTSSDASQFPSIIDIPTPGCWRLTLKAGATTGHIVIDVVPGR